MDLVSFIQELTTRVVMAAWALFLLAWAIGWALRGSPVPIYRVKRAGQDILEDAIMGAFWLALGTTVFALIYYIASNIAEPMPPPPTP
mgnify:CR=1 FL=1